MLATRVFGGAAGALTGGLIGHSRDQRERARTVIVVPPPSTPVTQSPTSIEEIKSMTRAGVSEDVIINQINATHASYQLNADAIVDLNRTGVSPRVINHMISTHGAA